MKIVYPSSGEKRVEEDPWRIWNIKFRLTRYDRLPVDDLRIASIQIDATFLGFKNTDTNFQGNAILYFSKR